MQIHHKIMCNKLQPNTNKSNAAAARTTTKTSKRYSYSHTSTFAILLGFTHGEEHRIN